MAFVDDARHSGKVVYVTHHEPWPRQYYSLAALGTSLLLWLVIIVAVLHLF